MLTNIKTSFLSVFTLTLLSLTNPSYTFAANLTTFDGIGDISIDSATQATIRSGTLSTVFTGGGNASLEQFLNIDLIQFATVIPNNVFGSAIKKALFVNAGDVIAFDYNFSATDARDVAFVTVGNDIILLTGSTFNSTFTSSGSINFGIGVVDVDGSEGESNLLVSNVNINSVPTTGVPFEFSPALGLLTLGACLVLKKLKP